MGDSREYSVPRRGRISRLGPAGVSNFPAPHVSKFTQIPAAGSFHAAGMRHLHTPLTTYKVSRLLQSCVEFA